MKPVNVALAAIAAPLVLALPAEIAERQAARPRVQIEPALYPVLQRYTRFAVASLATFTFNLGTCPSPPFKSTLVRTIANLLTDTQAAIFKDDAAKELIVSFPGTSSVQDFVTDFAFLPLDQSTAPGCTDCRVHGAFYVAWRSIADEVAAALADLRAKNPGYSTILTGHSLGGALAILAFTDLKASGVPVKTAYTMGAPRVGNKAYADFNDRLSGASDSNLGSLIRITHGIDGVPGLPTQSMGFQHSQTEIFQLDNAAGTQSPETTYRCFGQEAEDCNRATATGFINQDHLVYTGIQMTNGAECRNAR
ncbi:lipase [Stagonosporopsis vannaccii]|nr:lipase [Stagonosporopsis vannaccii]